MGTDSATKEEQNHQFYLELKKKINVLPLIIRTENMGQGSEEVFNNKFLYKHK